MLTVDGKQIPTDKEGYLKDLTVWSPAVANAIAAREQLELSEQHWEIIYLLKDFYQRFQTAPAMRPFVKFVKQELGDEKGNSIYLLKLFPDSPAKLACKIAGLPRPTNCL